jgi:hypothetical protein
MKFLNTTLAAVLASTLALSSTAWAASGVAELVNVNGKVFVQQGEGFVPVSGTVLLQPGDQVMVGDESSAEINYIGGDCAVSINDKSLVRVTKKAPCGKGETAAIAGDSLIMPVMDGGSSTGLIVAGVFTAVAIGVVALSDKSASGN